MNSAPKHNASPRRLAADLLIRWSESDQFATDLLAAHDRKATLSGPDRALLNALVLGALRHATLIDAWIDELRDRGRLRDDVRWLLRLGLLELFILNHAPHAAVNETVKLASKREKPVVNAMLRRALREKDRLAAIAQGAPPAVRFSLPGFLVDGWKRRLPPAEFEALCRSFNEPAETIVRLNRLKAGTGDDAADPLLMAGAEPLQGIADFYRCADLPLGWLQAGLVYAQDPATLLAPTKLAPQPGEKVLDACAAPGGKSAVLAQLMNNHGTLVCTDPSPSRLERLRGNLHRLGVQCADVRKSDWSRPNTNLGPFDRILLDVPCSNTGVLRRRVDARWRITAKSIAELIPIQRAIFTHTLERLKPNGRLVYSTCSLESSENEEQVAWALKTFPQLKLIEQVTQWPHRTGWDGAFVAVFERVASAE